MSSTWGERILRKKIHQVFLLISLDVPVLLVGMLLLVQISCAELVIVYWLVKRSFVMVCVKAEFRYWKPGSHRTFWFMHVLMFCILIIHQWPRAFWLFNDREHTYTCGTEREASSSGACMPSAPTPQDLGCPCTFLESEPMVSMWLLAQQSITLLMAAPGLSLPRVLMSQAQITRVVWSCLRNYSGKSALAHSFRVIHITLYYV